LDLPLFLLSITALGGSISVLIAGTERKSLPAFGYGVVATLASLGVLFVTWMLLADLLNVML
jgi:hypothetical protein